MCLDCSRPAEARGFCGRCYARRKRRGILRNLTLREKLLSRAIINRDTGCWEWSGGKFNTGYAKFTVADRRRVAHEILWEMWYGPKPLGKVLDHLCRVRHCVNPAHLELVTHRENTLRGVGATARNATKERCPRGHLLVGENLILENNGVNGARRCRICRRAQNLTENLSEERRQRKRLSEQKASARYRAKRRSQSAPSLPERSRSG